MKLTSSNETLAENKVLILYILDKINKPVNNNELLQLVLSIEDMNYFYFQQFLLDLLENKYIKLLQNGANSEQTYLLTDLGKQTLELTKDLVPGIIKLKVDSTIKGELQNIEDEISITSDFMPEDSGGFTVSCKITENNKTTFSVSIYASSRDQAKNIADNWKENAIDIYPEIIKLLAK